MNLNCDISCKAEGTVLDAKIDKGQGIILTALVQKGVLNVGDIVLAGNSWGKVKRLLSDQNQDLKSAEPSTPIQVYSFNYFKSHKLFRNICFSRS